MLLKIYLSSGDLKFDNKGKKQYNILVFCPLKTYLLKENRKANFSNYIFLPGVGFNGPLHNG